MSTHVSVSLKLQDEVEYVYLILPDQMLPAMGQAALGLQCIDDPEVIKIVQGLDDEYSRIETTIERDFVDMLEGGCQVPIGVNAFVMENDDILVKAVLGMPNGEEIMTDSRIVSRDQYETIGREMAQKMIDRGAKELLARAEAMGNDQ